MQKKNNFMYVCRIHKTQCMLFGSSENCFENAILCSKPQCMDIHSKVNHEHNFYAVRDLKRISNELKVDLEKTASIFKDRIDEIIKKAKQYLDQYKQKKYEQIECNILQLYSKNEKELSAIQKIYRANQLQLTCQEVQCLYNRHAAQKKQINYPIFDVLEQLIQSTYVDIQNNNMIFKFQDKRYSNRKEENQQIQNLKRLSTMSPQLVQNDNIALCRNKWERLTISDQQQIHHIVQNMKWEDQQWDLSLGPYGDLQKLLKVSFVVKSTILETLKMFNNNIITIKPLTICKFPNLAYLYLSNNQIQSLENMLFIQLPNLKRFACYQNHLTSIQPLVKAYFPRLKYLFLTSNFIIDIEGIRKCFFPRLVQLSINNNLMQSLQWMNCCDFPKMYYLNLKNKGLIRNEEDKYIKEKSITTKYPFAFT